MNDHRCNDLNCPYCYPEYWQPENNDHHALAWPYAAALGILAIALAFVMLAGAP